jgi:zinc D-Ala-D-Ala carboxypeptidase
LKKRIASLLAVAALTLTLGAVAAPNASAQVSSHCSYTSSEPSLSEGSSGTAVKQLQCQLRFSVLSSNLTPDGDFGPATLADVKKFQSCAHLTVDGIVGPNTWASLDYWTNSPSFVC